MRFSSFSKVFHEYCYQYAHRIRHKNPDSKERQALLTSIKH